MDEYRQRGSQAPNVESFNPSHQVWGKFFERHQILPVVSANRSRPPPSSSNRHKTSTGPSESFRSDNSSTAHNRRPRRSHSAKDLLSTGRENVQAGYGKALSDRGYEESLSRLRRLVLLEGVPDDKFSLPGFDRQPARPLIWKMLLDVQTVDAAHYLALVARGPSAVHDKIQDDAFRTLATDQSFKDRVDEMALIRMLDAFVWHFESGNRDGLASFSYVQGMNVLAAPFLYVMQSEVEAFYCFCSFIQGCCPTYVQPTLTGVHEGLQLVEKCLQIADPALSKHLQEQGLNAEVYAFPSILTLCACTPPLRQVLQVWDYLLAFGAHLAVPCVVAQLLLIRDELMSTTQPMRLLRQFPNLDARSIIGICTTLVRDLDEVLYEDLVQHTIRMRDEP